MSNIGSQIFRDIKVNSNSNIRGSRRDRDFRESSMNSILNLGANNTRGDHNTNSIKEGMKNIEIRTFHLQLNYSPLGNSSPGASR